MDGRELPELTTEIFTNVDDSVAREDLWRRRLDDLMRGECSEADFIDDLSHLREAGPDSVWGAVAWLDQRYRRGQMPAALFHSLESKIARRELGVADYGTTIDLVPIAHANSAAAPISPSDTIGILTGANIQTGRVLRHRYVIESRLGRGGMGTVYKATDNSRSDLPEASRHVAMKFLHHKNAERTQAMSNLRREFYCAQTLSHPNIVKVFELDRDADVEFFTMEFLEGELLSRLMEKSKPPARAQAWTIIQEAADGLAHAHARNIVHADFKPQNIMVTPSGEIRILDFGAASTLSGQRVEDAERSGSVALTPAYASCELLEGQDADPRDDLYALACVSYELLTGEHPFQRRRSTEARDQGLIAARPQGLTRRQWHTLAMGLSWRREDRSISVGDWIAQFKPAPPLAKRWTRAQIKRSALAVLGVALLGSALWSALGPRPTNPKIAAGAPATSTPVAASQPDAVRTYAPILAETSALLAAPAAVAGSTARIPFIPTASINANSPATPPATTVATAKPPAPAPAAPAPARAAPALAPAALAPAPAALQRPVKPRANSISISARAYRAGWHANFAEVRISRSQSDGDTSFVWWTEPSTALPGIDYVAQGRTTQFMSMGRRTQSVFVKLLPNASRRKSASFYIAIGEPTNGAVLGDVTRTVVSLSPR